MVTFCMPLLPHDPKNPTWHSLPPRSIFFFISSDGFRTHHCELYRNVGWSFLSDRKERHHLLLIDTALQGKLPDCLASLLIPESPGLHTRSWQFLSLGVPKLNTELVKLAFSYLFTWLSNLWLFTYGLTYWSYLADRTFCVELSWWLCVLLCTPLVWGSTGLSFRPSSFFFIFAPTRFHSS